MSDGADSSPAPQQTPNIDTALEPALERALSAMEARVAEEVRRTSGHWPQVEDDESAEQRAHRLVAAYLAEAKLVDAERGALLLGEVARLQEEVLSDPRLATRTILQALRRDPNSPTIQRDTLRLLRDAGKQTILAQLVDDLANELQSSPGRSALLLDHAQNVESSHEERAALVYERVLSDDPSAVEAAEGLLRIALKQRDWARVARVARDLAARAEDQPSRRGLLIAAALLDRDRGAGERAEWLAKASSLEGPLACASGRRAAQGLPRSIALPMAVGLFRAAGDVEGAVRVLLEHTEGAPEGDAAELHFQVSWLWAQQEGREEDALRHARRAMEHGEESLLYASWLAELLERSSRWTELAKTLERKTQLVTTREEAVETLVALADVLAARLDQPDRAIAALQRALDVSPRDLACLQALGRLYAQCRRFSDLAEMHLKEASVADDDEQRAQALYRCAQILDDRLERRDEAVAHLEKALELRPSFAAARQLLEELYSKTSQHRALIGLYQGELAECLDPTARTRLLERIATLADLQLDDQELAIESYEALLELDPRHALALPALARLYHQRAEHTKLLSVLRAQAMLTEDQAERATLLLRMGQILEDDLGQPEQALAHYREALDTLATPQSYEHLGRLLHRLQRWSELVDLTEQQLESAQGEEKLALYFRVGQLQERHLDNLEAAAAAYKRALQIDGAYWPAIRGIVRAAHHMPELRRASLEGMLLPTTVEGSDKLSAQLRVALALGPQRPQAAKALLQQIAKEHPHSAIARDLLLQLLAADRQYGQILEFAEGLDAVAVALGGLQDLSKAFTQSGADTDAEPQAMLRWRELLAHATESEEVARRCLSQRIDLEKDEGLRASLRLRLARGQDDPLLAGNLCREILQEDPTDRRALDRLEHLGRLSGNRQLLAEAMTRRETQARNDCERAMLRAARGSSHHLGGEHDKAEEAWRGALELDAACRPAYDGLKDLYRQRGDDEGLRWALERGLEGVKETELRVPDLLRRAELRHGAGDGSGAVADLDTILELDPCQPAALTAIEGVLRETAHYSRLARRLEHARAAATTPLRLAALNVKLAALCLEHLEDPRRGAQLLAEAIDKDPDNVAALLLGARAQAQLDQPTEAVALLSRAILRSEDDHELIGAHLATAELFHRTLGVGDRALRSLRTVLKLDPKHREALDMLAEICEGTGNLEEAEAYLARLSRLVEPGPEQGKTLGRLAEVLRRRHGDDDERLVPLALEAAQLAPAEAPLVQRAVEALQRAERYQDLAELLDGALDVLPEERKLDFLLIRGETLALHLGQPEEAKRLLRQALAKDPDRAHAMELLTGLLDEADLDDAETRLEAMQLHRRLLAQSPLTVESIRRLATISERHGHIDEAFSARAALVFLGQASEEEAYFHKQRRRALPHRAKASITAAQRDELLMPAGDHPVREVLALLKPHISELTAPDLSQYGLSDLEAAQVGEEHPAWQVVHDCAELLGVNGFAIAEALGGAALGATEPAARPTLVLPRDFVRQPMPQQRFLCGRMLARVATDSECADPQRPEALSSRTVEMLLAALLRADDGSFGDEIASSMILDDMARRLEACLDDEALAQAQAGAKRALEDAPRSRLQPWLASLDGGAHQAGLLCAGTLDVLVGIAERRGSALGPELSGDLVRFATSSAFSALRKQVGLALEEAP